ncbi:DUF805 domain-containing protein [Antribacter gilvus]|uniref:DUF805 domain-containing protein n=1 Tax=Antribacter gilvus TaxID=2304675 RepID=UPI000F79719B|nr:DUF805 domain-containing protein [Antribacter gilvus]
MSFVESIRTCLSKFVDFKGRARRSEYWWFALAVAVVMSVVYAVAVAPGLTEYMTSMTAAAETGVVPAAPASYSLGMSIYGLVSLALFLPSLAAIVRRLHDTGRSGFWYFFVLVPIVGPIMLIVWAATAGTAGDNQFGPDPKAEVAAAV